MAPESGPCLGWIVHRMYDWSIADGSRSFCTSICEHVVGSWAVMLPAGEGHCSRPGAGKAGGSEPTLRLPAGRRILGMSPTATQQWRISNQPSSSSFCRHRRLLHQHFLRVGLQRMRNQMQLPSSSQLMWPGRVQKMRMRLVRLPPAAKPAATASLQAHDSSAPQPEAAVRPPAAAGANDGNACSVQIGVQALCRGDSRQPAAGTAHDRATKAARGSPRPPKLLPPWLADFGEEDVAEGGAPDALAEARCPLSRRRSQTGAEASTAADGSVDMAAAQQGSAAESSPPSAEEAEAAAKESPPPQVWNETVKCSSLSGH